MTTTDWSKFDPRTVWAERIKDNATDWEAAYELWSHGADQENETRWAYEAGFVQGQDAIATALTRKADRERDRADELEDILRDLLFCHGEQRAIGGGPGWQERDRRAWAAAEDYFGDPG